MNGGSCCLPTPAAHYYVTTARSLYATAQSSLTKCALARVRPLLLEPHAPAIAKSATATAALVLAALHLASRRPDQSYIHEAAGFGGSSNLDRGYALVRGITTDYLSLHWQSHREFAAVSKPRTVAAHASTVQIYNHPYQGEADAQAVAGSKNHLIRSHE